MLSFSCTSNKFVIQKLRELLLKLQTLSIELLLPESARRQNQFASEVFESETTFTNLKLRMSEDVAKIQHGHPPKTSGLFYSADLSSA